MTSKITKTAYQSKTKYRCNTAILPLISWL